MPFRCGKVEVEVEVEDEGKVELEALFSDFKAADDNSESSFDFPTLPGAVDDDAEANPEGG